MIMKLVMHDSETNEANDKDDLYIRYKEVKNSWFRVGA